MSRYNKLYILYVNEFPNPVTLLILLSTQKTDDFLQTALNDIKPTENGNKMLQSSTIQNEVKLF